MIIELGWKQTGYQNIMVLVSYRAYKPWQVIDNRVLHLIKCDSNSPTEKEWYHEVKHSTFPSYSCLSNTSGAIYAGVPTVDFGCEWSTEDWK